MPTPLPTLSPLRDAPPADPAESWSAFLRRRETLTARMELATCDGCDACGTRCLAGFTVTRAERDAMNAYIAQQPEAEVRRVREQNKTIPWPGGEEFGVTITFCRYRDMEGGRCSVYPVRPTICRLFGHTHWLPCPIEAVKATPSGAGEVWGAYRTFEHRTWEAWEEA